MRVLFLHADRFSYKVTGETSVTKLLDPIPLEMNEGNADEVLVCFIAVEKNDAEKATGIVSNFIKEIESLASSINCRRVFLYPYAHLSAELESPRAAVKVLDLSQEMLTERGGYEIFRAPFGVYKEFDIKIKGHPLSELGKTITAEKGESVLESSALKAEFALQ